MRKLTDRVIGVFPSIRWTSADVREGLCRLEECHKTLPGSFYDPEEIFSAVEAGEWNRLGNEIPENGDWEVAEILNSLTAKCWEERFGKDGRKYPLGIPSIADFLN